jgi:hypothetical protein
MGLPPVGCAPRFLWEYGSQNGECIEYINNVVIEFNYASSEFTRPHPDSVISYCDTRGVCGTVTAMVSIVVVFVLRASSWPNICCARDVRRDAAANANAFHTDGSVQRERACVV